MELNKDTYLYLAQFADDRTILNMLSVNKKFNDPEFFRQVMERKYPMLVKFKKSEDWKRFYIGMVYCIAKIQEEFGIPYYPLENYNPKNYCNRSKQDILNVILYLAAKENKKQIVEEVISRGANNFNRGMSGAAEGGHLDLVKLFIDLGAYNFNYSMYWAARGGHLDLVKLFIDLGADNFNWAMSGAAQGGHIDLVKLFVDLGAYDFNLGMYVAASGGHLDIIKLFIDLGADDFNSAMEGAARGGLLEIVDYLKTFVNND